MAFNKRGEQVVTAVLTEEKVRAIRAIYAQKKSLRDGISVRALARQFGISESQLHRILKWKAWAHVRSI